MPAKGRWREILNSDATAYGGSGVGNGGAVEAEGDGGYTARMTLPPLSSIVFAYDP
jgi:1,4-alpha-glucan branching enzyme